MVAKNKLSWMLFAMFSLCFGYLYLHLLIGNTQYGYDKAILLPLIFLSLFLFVYAYRVIRKHEKTLDKNYLYILVAYLTLMAILQVVFGVLLRYKPLWDLDAVYGGAVQWVTEGDFSRYHEYYGFFPNNKGGMVIFYAFFKLADAVGIKDYFMVATVLNCFLSIGTMFTTSSICKKILGTRYALLSLLFFGLSLPFYFIAPVFYTDALSMFFPTFIYYLYLRSKDEEKLLKRLLLYSLIGLTAGIGMEIKFTVSIMVIAIVIESLLQDKLRNALTMTGVLLLPILIVFTIFNAVIYGNHLSKIEAKKYNTPYLHWVMMGLKGNGNYNPEDYEFTRSFTELEERDRALRKEIWNRIKEHGPGGMLELLTRKGERIFGDGTYALSDFLDDEPTKDRGIHKYILYAGEHYKTYRHICQGVHMAVLLFMLFSCFQEVLSKKSRFRPFLAPRLAVFGVLLFFSFWETSGRYFINFIPMVFLSGVMGMDYFIRQIKSLCKNINSSFHNG